MTVTTEQALTWPLTVSRWSPANSSTDSPQYCSQARSLKGGAWASAVAARLSWGRTSSLDPNCRDLHHWPHYGTVWASQLIAADVSTCFKPSKIITHIWKTVKETLAVQKDRSVMGKKIFSFCVPKVLSINYIPVPTIMDIKLIACLWGTGDIHRDTQRQRKQLKYF